MNECSRTYAKRSKQVQKCDQFQQRISAHFCEFFISIFELRHCCVVGHHIGYLLDHAPYPKTTVHILNTIDARRAGHTCHVSPPGQRACWGFSDSARIYPCLPPRLVYETTTPVAPVFNPRGILCICIYLFSNCLKQNVTYRPHIDLPIRRIQQCTVDSKVGRFRCKYCQRLPLSMGMLFLDITNWESDWEKSEGSKSLVKHSNRTNKPSLTCECWDKN